MAILKSAQGIVLVKFNSPPPLASLGGLLQVDFASFSFQECTSETFRAQPDFRQTGRYRHNEPEIRTLKTQQFAERLKLPAIREECSSLHDRARQILGYRLSDMSLSSQTLDTPDFRFSVVIEQSAEEPSEILIYRKLVLRKSIADLPGKLNEVFEHRLPELVFDKVQFPTGLLKFLEDLTDRVGGTVDYWGDHGFVVDLTGCGRFYMDLTKSELTYMTTQAPYHQRWEEFCSAWLVLSGTGAGPAPPS